jgi:hypothetical protein
VHSGKVTDEHCVVDASGNFFTVKMVSCDQGDQRSL